MKKLLIITIILLIPSLCFGYTLNISLKDIYSQPIDFTKVKIQVIDLNSNLSQEIIPTSNDIRIEVPYDEYKIVASSKDLTREDKPTTYISKNIKLTEGNNFTSIVLTKPVATNVSLILTNIPEDWTQAKLTLVPANISTFSIDSTNLSFIINIEKGRGLYQSNNFPAGKFNYHISKTDGSDSFFSNKLISINNNTTATLPYKWVKKPSAIISFKATNTNLTSTTFSNEKVVVTLKDSNNNIIGTENITLAGDTTNMSFSNLNNGQYTISAQLTLNNGIKKNFTRTTSLFNKDKTTTINLPVTNDSKIDFDFVDSRTSNPVTSTLTISDNYTNEVIGTYTDKSITAYLQTNHPHKLKIEATGYYPRTLIFIPKENIKKEIPLKKLER